MAPSSPSAPPSLPQPVESTKRSQPRFAPDDTILSRPSRGQEQLVDDAPTARPRIPPRPLESTVRSSNTNKTQPRDTILISSATPDVTPPLPRRKLPQPIESTESSSKPRKFAPQLVETTSRQRKRGDTLPAVLDTDKTEHSPDDAFYLPRHLRIARPSPLPIPPVNSPVVSTNHVPQLHESNFSYSSLSQRANLDKPDRRHSFRVPELPSIPSQTEESDGSDDSTCPSLSTTPSAKSDEIEYIKNKRNHDGTRAGYLLSLAAQAAEKQLREQAMAAYPNEHSHEPVDHFAIDREDDSDKEGKGHHQADETLTRNGMSPRNGNIERASNGNGKSVRERIKQIARKGNAPPKSRQRSIIIIITSNNSIATITSTTMAIITKTMPTATTWWETTRKMTR
ncbi:MAG: hypothetical protein L6R35_006975 [Caloplaca aegaea]|nr:MAG: hypothetical protein L6R35_006975 [Caloplaca aegaea]